MLVGRQGAESFRRGQLQVHAHSVRQIACPFNDFRIRTWDGLHMHIAVKPVFIPQQRQRPAEQLHGKCGIPDNARAQKQALYIIPAVKFHCQGADFLRRKSGPGNIVGTTVAAVFAVKNALIGEKYFQKGDAPSVPGKTVADARSHTVPNALPVPLPLHTAGSTSHIIFSCVREHLQLFRQGLLPARHKIFHLQSPSCHMSVSVLQARSSFYEHLFFIL